LVGKGGEKKRVEKGAKGKDVLKALIAQTAKPTARAGIGDGQKKRQERGMKQSQEPYSLRWTFKLLLGGTVTPSGGKGGEKRGKPGSEYRRE